MVAAGAAPKRLIAKIVGGAMMFKIADQSMMGEIGKNNVQKTRDVLAALGIAIIAEDVYGDYGRTIDFFSADGSVKIKSIGASEKLI
jgi:chemotaxis protein CheD